MGEAKRRKDLGLSPRQKQIEIPKIDKDEIKKKVRLTLYKYPIIPFIFYGFAILILILGIVFALKFYK
tara:strand:- start:276 stop:479 length:204 start_codon:yes stop_codon:yes gene_type:complete